jgi:hypothetical protein
MSKAVTAPRELKIKGQDHMLAYITRKEADLLKARGGSGRKTRYGIPSYEDGDGSDGSDGSNGSDSDTGGDAANSEAGTAAAAGGVSGTGAGPTGAGAGDTNETGPSAADVGISGADLGLADVAPAAPTATVNTAPFGQAPSALGMGLMGMAASAVTGVPGLSALGTAIGTGLDVGNLNEQLGMMGLDPTAVSYDQALANAMSLGAMGKSATDQFGQALGFDALAEAPMSAFSTPDLSAPPSFDTASEYALLNEQLPTGLDPLATPTTSPYNPAGGYVVVNGNIVPRASLGLLG